MDLLIAILAILSQLIGTTKPVFVKANVMTAGLCLSECRISHAKSAVPTAAIVPVISLFAFRASHQVRLFLALLTTPVMLSAQLELPSWSPNQQVKCVTLAMTYVQHVWVKPVFAHPVSLGIT
jgi:hypothetical protein